MSAQIPLPDLWFEICAITSQGRVVSFRSQYGLLVVEIKMPPSLLLDGISFDVRSEMSRVVSGEPASIPIQMTFQIVTTAESVAKSLRFTRVHLLGSSV
jgi:hypothetical protein